MSSLLDLLSTGRHALRVQQLAMQVIGENTANVGTDGYTRRRLELTTSPPYNALGVWQTGSGVDIDSLARVRDRLIDDQIRRAGGAYGYWSQRDDILGKVEETFNQLDGGGISDQLQQFWAAWQDLSNGPEGMGARYTLVQKAESLAAGVRRAYSEVTTQREEVDGRIGTAVAEVNDLTSTIARLNVQIVNFEIDGREASDLRDERDRAIDRLSKIVDINVQENADGAINIYNGGQVLVQVERTTRLETTTASTNGRTGLIVTYGESGRTLTLQGGEMKGLFELRDNDLGTVLNDLDSFAVALANRVNDVHRTGYGLQGGNGVEFFANDVSGAMDLKVSSLITDDPSRIAASGTAGATGDNTIALAIAGIQSEKLMQNGRSTLDDFFRDSTLQLSSRKSYAASQLKVEQGAMDNLEARRQEVSGVSMDEEMTRLIQVQQAYEAAAKLINTVDEMTQTILSLGNA